MGPCVFVFVVVCVWGVGWITLAFAVAWQMGIVSAQYGVVQKQQQLLFIHSHYFLAFRVDFPVITVIIIYLKHEGGAEIMAQPKSQNTINTSLYSSFFCYRWDMVYNLLMNHWSSNGEAPYQARLEFSFNILAAKMYFAIERVLAIVSSFYSCRYVI